MAAWYPTYRTEFTDILQLDWRVDIEEWLSSQGSITTMQATSTPLNIEFLTNSDDILNEPVKGSTASINIYSDSNFQWSTFYAYGQLKYRVSIYYDTSTLYWRGYINSEGYQEPYDGIGYPVVISASDGLGQLKDHLYDITDPYPSGSDIVPADYYTGRISEAQVILDILTKINVTEFTEFVNIYETSINSGMGDSVFDQIWIDVDIFKDKSCYDVLEAILKKYNAVIRSKAGVYIIYRPTELTGTTVYGRVFTDAYTKTSTSITPAQLIDRSTSVTDIHDIEGGSLMVQPPAKLITINQDYGNKDSWLDNWDLKGSTYNYNTSSFESWTSHGITSITPPTYFMPTELDGMLIHDHHAGSDSTWLVSGSETYMSQIFGSHAIASTDWLTLSFDYGFYNYSGSPITGPHAYVDLICGTDHLYQWDTSQYAWGSITNHIDLGMPGDHICYTGFTGWQSISLKIAKSGGGGGSAGLPFPGPLEIRIYPMNDGNPTLYYVIKNIKFYNDSEKIIFLRQTTPKYSFLRNIRLLWYDIFKGGNHLVPLITPDSTVVKPILKPNSIAGNSLDYEYSLGDVIDADIDNIVEQFGGALSFVTRDTLSQTAIDFYLNHHSDYLGILITYSGNDIIFTENDGNDFTGSTTISNLTGDLSGTVVNTQSHISAVARVDQVTKSGYPAGCNITCNGLTKALTWTSNATTSMQNFVTSWYASYLATGVFLTNGSAGQCLFTAQVPGVNFTGATSSTGTGDSVSTLTPNQVAQVRIDTITLTGVYGTANITCDAITKGVDVDEPLAPTIAWSTRGGSENDLLLSVIGDELALQYSRPKQLIQLPILEKGNSSIYPQINLIGNFQDSLNTYGGNPRIFVLNRGMFNVRDREWDIDIIEII